MANIRMLKYPLFDVLVAAFDDRVRVPMPEPLSPVFIAMQRGVVTLWALVDCDSAQVARDFFIAGTGHSIPAGATYLGSVMERVFVWHIFEVTHG